MILVMSGTKDGKDIVRSLHSKGIDVITTVVTGYGKQMLEEAGLGKICIQRRMDAEQLLAFIEEHNIETVIDATHPYAAQASINAITACKKKGIHYLRYERESTPIPDSPLIHKVTTVDDAVELCKTLGTRILLATGFTTVPKFRDLMGAKEIIVRILPIREHISKCLELGVTASNIIAARGPFSVEANIKTIRDYNIDVIVTKDSGIIGGTPGKIEAALKERIKVVLIIRPQIQYPAVYTSPESLFQDLNI